MSNSTMDAKLANVRHLALDMDGTIYKGGTLFDFTKPFLESLDELGIGFTFLTNNSSRSCRDYLRKLDAMGLPVQAEQVFTAGMGAVEFLRAEHSDYRRLFILGTESLRKEFSEAGFELVENVDQGEPDAVVVAFDTDLVYERLCCAGYWIDQGKPFIATHPDLICPTDKKTLLVDCGALTACLAAATGRQPDIVLGKPHPVMLEGILRSHKLQPEQLAMVGDRLSTDILMAKTADTLGVLVLTGEATAQDAADFPVKADIVVADLAELGERLANSSTG